MKKLINFLIVFVIFLTFGTILINNYEILYTINDDIALRSIVAGRFAGTPSLYMIFSGFPYSVLLVILYNIINKIDWYGLTLVLLTAFFLCYTIYNVIKSKKDILKNIIYVILMFTIVAFLYNNFLVELTFTSTSIFIASCCLILYLLPDNKGKNIIMTIGILLSFGLRIKSCLMILVFFIPALFYKNYENKEGIKKDFWLGIKIGAILLICFIIEKSLYNTKEWKEYIKYNNLRSLYYDYYYNIIEDLPEETRKEIFYNAGFSEEEMTIVRNYSGIAFYEDIPNKMENLIEQCKIHNLKLNKSIKKSIKKLSKMTINARYNVTLAIIAILIILSKDKKKSAKIILPFVILQFAILLYLVKGGRTPDRVMVPLYTCYIVTNIYIIFKEDVTKKIFDKIMSYKIVTLLVLIMSVLLFSSSLKKLNVNTNISYYAKRGNVIEEYFKNHPNNVYIYDNNYLDKFEIINKYVTSNYINMGGWTAYSPIYKKAIKNHGAKNLKELLFKDNVYMVLTTTDINIYKDIDPEAKIEAIDTIDEFHIYKFTK